MSWSRTGGRIALLLFAALLVSSCATTGGATRLAAKAPAVLDPAGSPLPGSSSRADGAASGGSSSRQAAALGSPAAEQEPPSGGAGAPAGSGEAPPAAPSAAQINEAVYANGAKGSRPLSHGSDAVVVERRISPGSAPLVFALYVAVDKQSEAELAKLSDFSRLFEPKVEPVGFTLAEFADKSGRLEEVRTFPLGRHLVFEKMDVVSIRKGSLEPFAVSVAFQTQEGASDHWVTFSKEGTSEITLPQTLSRSPIVEDIDNDGYLDIVIRERGVEEGTGYETFLTWYKWNGHSFAEYKSTNIVRNLKGFLDRAATLLTEDRPAAFFRSSLPPVALSKLEKKGLSHAEIFTAVFSLVPSTPFNPNAPIPNLAAISQVIFPSIFENPFTERNSHGYAFPMTVRVVTSDSESHFYTATVYMHRNPFVEPQFSFAVGAPAQLP